MKLLKIGVAHHDCWGSFSTEAYPTISMTEMGAVKIVRENHKGVLVDSFFRITADKAEELTEYLAYIAQLPSIKQQKIYLRKPYEAYVYIQFLSPTSSYNEVLKQHALSIGPIVQEHGLEIHTVATEDPQHTVRLLNALDHIGEVKVFRIGEFNEESLSASLTERQQQALLHAHTQGYYQWPRKTGLQELAAKLGMKRRTFQEHLRLAEVKLIPAAIEKLLKERKF